MSNEPLTELLTDDQYWKSQDDRAKVLDPRREDAIKDIGQRELVAHTLYNAGLNPDRDIWIWGWEAARVMLIRQKYYRVPWVPNAFQPPLTAQTDMSKPWDRSIRTSTDPNDYRPFDPPPPPVPVALDDVGLKVGEYYAAPLERVLEADGQWKYAEGAHVVHNGEDLYFHLGGGIFGVTPIWLTAAQYKQWKETGAL